MAQIPLAKALLMRKQLQEKVDQLKPINNEKLFIPILERRPASEGYDDIKGRIPKVSFEQLTYAFDWHSKRLREVDGVIQQANWATPVEVPDHVMEEFRDQVVPNELLPKEKKA